MSIGAIVVACGLLYWSLVGGWTNQEYRYRHRVDVRGLNGRPCSSLSLSGGGSEDRALIESSK
jgi:hypothetical protein